MSHAPHLQPIASIARGDVSASEAVRACMTAVVKGDTGPDRLNAFISYDYDAAVDAAEQLDRRGGARGLLTGVPIAIKDNICTAGLPTTCASRHLAAYRSPFEATAVERLRAAGAVIAGKTNMDEFGMGTSTATSAFGATRNPHDAGRSPGGSSGGSAAAVAAGLVPVALGSDSGGSVRQPAAFCGVVGLRPTYGRVSRSGLVAFASSFDQVGVLARSVADAALVLAVISGMDERDALTAERTAPEPAPGGPRDGIVVGVPDEYFGDGLHAGVRDACDSAIAALRESGCVIRSVSLPLTPHGLPAYHLLSCAEASSNLARFDGVRFGMRAGDVAATRTAGFGGEAIRRIMLGTYLLGVDHPALHEAARVSGRIGGEFAAAFGAGIDVLFTPTTPTPAFAAGHADDPTLGGSDAFTAPASLAGLPAVSVPIGTTDGMPVGGQLIAPRWGEDTLLAVAARLERELRG